VHQVRCWCSGPPSLPFALALPCPHQRSVLEEVAADRRCEAVLQAVHCPFIHDNGQQHHHHVHPVADQVGSAAAAAATEHLSTRQTAPADDNMSKVGVTPSTW